jgi:hypothetical protein
MLIKNFEALPKMLFGEEPNFSDPLKEVHAAFDIRGANLCFLIAI